MTWSNISPKVFELDPGIRYLAVNQGGGIVEMAQLQSGKSKSVVDDNYAEAM